MILVHAWTRRVRQALYQVFGSGTDLGILAEYLYDGREATAPPTPFDDDLFVGTRLTLNDPQSAELLMGAIIDRHTQATLASLKGSPHRR